MSKFATYFFTLGCSLQTGPLAICTQIHSSVDESISNICVWVFLQATRTQIFFLPTKKLLSIARQIFSGLANCRYTKSLTEFNRSLHLVVSLNGRQG